MLIDPWLPRGYSPLPGTVVQQCSLAGNHWQLYETTNDGRVLIAAAELAEKWLGEGLLEGVELCPFDFGAERYALILGGRRYRLEPVSEADVPDNFTDCQAFVSALVETRKVASEICLHDALFIERLSRLLPCYTPAPKTDDANIVGYWITGGVNVSILSARRMHSLVPWLTNDQLIELAEMAGLARIEKRNGVGEADRSPARESKVPSEEKSDVGGTLPDFKLPGRPELEDFFNEHVIDLIRNEDRYRALGIGFPGAILLWGPPGCGKTFAVEKLVEHLDWPSFSVDSGSIGSPYIHETGKKIAEIFAQAAKVSPSLVVLDEIDAFLATRDGSASGQHRVEEVAEFLRSIPKAAENQVLVIGMTNRVDSLDPAVVRRGRFDHILEVGMPSELEVHALLDSTLAAIPTEGNIDVSGLARALAGRPLSDAGFIIREACRLAAKSGASKLGDAHVQAALKAAPSRGGDKAPRRIGFV